MTADPSSVLGYGLFCTYCTVTLPMPDGSTRTITTVQPTFGSTLGPATDPKTGKVLPSDASGRQLLGGAIVCRLSTERNTLPDVHIPSTTTQYGIDLLDNADADMTLSDVAQLSASVDAQLRLDERIVTSTTSATLVSDTLLVSIAARDGTGPFKLVMAIDTLTQDLTVLATP